MRPVAALPWLMSELARRSVSRPETVMLVLPMTGMLAWPQLGKAVRAEAAATRTNLIFMVAPFEAWWMGCWGTRHPGVGVEKTLFIQHSGHAGLWGKSDPFLKGGEDLVGFDHSEIG